ncbi:PAS domain S-box protein [Chitinophaga pendula]|uniref:PAS domain S-box protein n=1 Tax=Chitinophaga TaxID=79328 RepID=UPI000BB0C1F8|nr:MULTISPECIES: PAS domain S-box protein [Chitinophaga]ASZ12690.1 hypothetical protein CK934_17865 [Chitinophaga sp. MD30]UCJ09698.1 PAS domain S-box protein [Chitinophaga pendula]
MSNGGILSFEASQISGTGLPYQEFLNSVPIAAYTCNSDGYIQLFNETAAVLFGRRLQPGVDRWVAWWKAYQMDGTPLAPEASPMAIALREKGPVYGHQLIIERPDGVRRVITPYPKAIVDEQGQVTGGINFVIDVTEETQVASEHVNRLAAIVTSSDDAIISKTLDGIITSWNASAQRIFGYTAEEIIGKSILTIIPQDRQQEEVVIQQRLRQGERIEHFETKRITKNGEILDIALTVSPIKDSFGKIIGASKIIRDVTAQQMAERQIRESETLFRMAVESTRLGTWEYLSMQDHFTWSEESRRIWGFPKDIPVSYQTLLQQVHPEDLDHLKRNALMAMTPDQGGHYNAQFRIFHYQDHQLRWVKAQGRVFFSADGQLERFIGTVLDITEEKLARESLEKTVQERTAALIAMNEELQRSNHDLEQFAYIASHDLQEPLRKIQTFTSVLQEQPDTPELREKYFPRIMQAANRMSKLIKDVLNYSRLSQSTLLKETIDLNQVLRDVLSEFDVLIEEKQAQIYVDHLPFVQGVYIQLQQLFANLLSNALKFCDTTPVITISHSLSPDRPHPHFYCVVIADKGIGFEQRYADKIFDIFKRLNSREQYAGTGVGLALCKKIMENHRGSIIAHSEPGKGTTFHLYFPLIEKEH